MITLLTIYTVFLSATEVGTSGGVVGVDQLGAAAGGAGGVASSLTSSILYGNTFGGSIVNAFSAALTGAVIGGLIGGVTNGISAVRHHGKFWDGDGYTFDQVAAISTSAENEVTIGDGMEYSNNYAKKFSDENFGEIKGLRELHADGTTPQGSEYKKVGDRVYKYSKKLGWQEVNGTAVYHKKVGTDVFIYKTAFESKEQLYLTMGHEYLHAIFNNAHLIDPNIQHESIHHWEYEQSKLFKMYYKYIPRRTYREYDKYWFAFTNVVY